jgi:HK97 family phage prohead protease
MTQPTATKRSHLREVRSVSVQNLEMRASANGSLTFSGYASVIGAPYRVSDMLGEYDEQVAAGAFAKALSENDDVRLMLNHDGVPLARTKSGTLSLREDEVGLFCEAQLDPKSPLVQTIRSAMSRGDLDQMSFAFSVVRQSWSPDYTQRTILECRLFDVSIVTYPASPTTSASMRDMAVRSASRGVEAGRLDEALFELRAGELTPANITLLEGVLTAIRNACEVIEIGHEVVDSAGEVLASVITELGGAPSEDPDTLEPSDSETMPEEMDSAEPTGMGLSLARAKARRI